MSRLADFKNQDSDRAKVSAWLDHINEHDEATRAEVLDACANDIEARKYFVSRHDEIPTKPPMHDRKTIAAGD